jgi:hypothetical protein
VTARFDGGGGYIDGGYEGIYPKGPCSRKEAPMQGANPRTPLKVIAGPVGILGVSLPGLAAV